MNENIRKTMEKQQYRFIGDHSAVKVCGWTKNLIRGQGGCYKLTFYGIMSHQCMQMTTSMSCANRCTFCWRGYKEPVSKDWNGSVDDPITIMEGSLAAHKKLLEGFKGHKTANQALVEQSNDVRHVALSLTGEPITYPRMNELLKEFNELGISTFIVTNAQYPESIKNLDKITQLYISVDAPNKELLKKIDVPLFSDFWERFMESLDLLAKRKDRTCIRMTMIKEMNWGHYEAYAKLINQGSPDFIEVKGYMFVGASRQVLSKVNMPYHEEIVEYVKEFVKFLPDYEIVGEHIASRVVLLAKKKFFIDGKWKTWIDYNKWHDLVLSGKEFDVLDYVIKTPNTGISGKGTRDSRKVEVQEVDLD